MKAPLALAVVSLGLAGFGGCHSRETVRQVEPRLVKGAKYARCLAGPLSYPGAIPNAVCAGRERPGKQEKPGTSGSVVRGKGQDVSGTTDETADLGDLLSNGDLRRISNAIRGLERRTAADPHDARGWSDLAAAYLVRAQKADDPRDLLRAYGAADQAVRENGSFREARFNRALALQRLFLFPEALAAWKDYQKQEPDPDWLAEAQRHIQELDRPAASARWEQQRERLERAILAGRNQEAGEIVATYRQAAREYAERELFGRWADAVLTDRPDLAAKELRVLKFLGDALIRTNGDRLIHDAVAVIDAAAGDPGRSRDLAEAHRSFRDGFVAYHQRKCALASARLSAARDALGRLGSPLALWAEFYGVCCDYLTNHYARGLPKAARLAGKVQELPYPALRGQVFRTKGVLEEGLGKTRAAVDDFGKMLAEFQHLGEEENVATASGLLSRPFSLLGRERQAWRFIYQGLRTLPDLRDDVASANLLLVASDAALRDGAEAAALAFEQARVRHALEADPLVAAESLAWLARLQKNLGDREAAHTTLEKARARVRRIEEPEPRRRQEADLAMIEGEMRVEDDPRHAVELLTPALAEYREDKNFLFALKTLLARSRAERRLGDDATAERDLAGALKLYDQLGRQLPEEDLRLTFLEETGKVFDEMVSLQAGHDPDLAFAYADRARTRVLPGSASVLWTGEPADDDPVVEPQPLPLDEIRRRLPPGITLVQFSVLPDQVLIWWLRRDGKGPDFRAQKISRRELELAASWLQDFNDARWETAGEKLFDLLVRPWLAEVPPGERVVLVPDEVLHRVPFGALKDHSTGKLLIENHPLAIAPSATLYIRALVRQAAMKPPGPVAGLVVGDPALDRKLFFDLPELPDSALEARKVAELTHARLLTGRDAGKTAFLDAAKQAEWIHFSGHALIDPRDPLLSKLVLAPEAEGDPGVLTALDVYRLKLDRTRLVVLAACDTGNEYIPGSEGATSLARAFLAAGVPTVVASLWSVDDHATARLFDRFHRFLIAGDDPVDALRKAQLELLHGSEPRDRSPRAWAAFEVIGASAE